MEYSKLSTVLYLQGNFYTDNWSLVYTPHDEADKQAFFATVSRKEEELGRQLTDKELGILVNS